MHNELVHRLPDSYAKPVRYREKETATNTWRLFALVESQADQLTKQIAEIFNLQDISICNGDALTRLGEMYGYPRQAGLDDAQYRVELLLKIAEYFCDASTNAVLQIASTVCGLETGRIYFVETTPATVQLHLGTLNTVNELPITSTQLKSLVQRLLAAGVRIDDTILIDGTFRYCAAGEEYSENWNSTGYNEQSAVFGSANELEG